MSANGWNGYKVTVANGQRQARKVCWAYGFLLTPLKITKSHSKIKPGTVLTRLREAQ